MRKVLVTGGLGYIGSHTCVALVEAGWKPVVVDNLSNSEFKNKDRIQEVTGEELVVYSLDLRDKEQVQKIFREHEFQAVVHFAGSKAVGESVAKPEEYYHNNLLSTFHVVECMKSFGVEKLVFSSSATVYAPSEKAVLVESSPKGSTNPYGRTKEYIESYLEDFSSANPEFSFCSLRYFNPVGAHPSGGIGEAPRGVPNNLMPILCQVAAGQRETLAIFGSDYPTHDGSCVRDYIHVCDLAEGHLAALDYVFSQNDYSYFNLGSGVGTSVLELVHIFEKVNGVTVPKKLVERRPGDLAAYFADPTKVFEVLGWETKRDINEMCRDAWNWQKRVLQV